MTVRRLLWCAICHYPVRWVDAVEAAGGWSHPDCADRYWTELARALHVR